MEEAIEEPQTGGADAAVEETDFPGLQEPIKETRSGRRVHFPRKLREYIP
jgi:hypothetical protein